VSPPASKRLRCSSPIRQCLNDSEPKEVPLLSVVSQARGEELAVQLGGDLAELANTASVGVDSYSPEEVQNDAAQGTLSCLTSPETTYGAEADSDTTKKEFHQATVFPEVLLSEVVHYTGIDWIAVPNRFRSWPSGSFADAVFHEERMCQDAQIDEREQAAIYVQRMYRGRAARNYAGEKLREKKAREEKLGGKTAGEEAECQTKREQESVVQLPDDLALFTEPAKTAEEVSSQELMQDSVVQLDGDSAVSPKPAETAEDVDSCSLEEDSEVDPLEATIEASVVHLAIGAIDLALWELEQSAEGGGPCSQEEAIVEDSASQAASDLTAATKLTKTAEDIDSCSSEADYMESDPAEATIEESVVQLAIDLATWELAEPADEVAPLSWEEAQAEADPSEDVLMVENVFDACLREKKRVDASLPEEFLTIDEDLARAWLHEEAHVDSNLAEAAIEWIFDLACSSELERFVEVDDWLSEADGHAEADPFEVMAEASAAQADSDEAGSSAELEEAPEVDDRLSEDELRPEEWLSEDELRAEGVLNVFLESAADVEGSLSDFLDSAEDEFFNVELTLSTSEDESDSEDEEPLRFHLLPAPGHHKDSSPVGRPRASCREDVVLVSMLLRTSEEFDEVPFFFGLHAWEDEDRSASEVEGEDIDCTAEDQIIADVQVVALDSDDDITSECKGGVPFLSMSIATPPGSDAGSAKEHYIGSPINAEQDALSDMFEKQHELYFHERGAWDVPLARREKIELLLSLSQLELDQMEAWQCHPERQAIVFPCHQKGWEYPLSRDDKMHRLSMQKREAIACGKAESNMYRIQRLGF